MTEQKIDYNRMMEDEIANFSNEKKPTLLLHSCCGPCSTTCLERLIDFFDVTIYFYNPNIQPEKHREYTSFMNLVPTIANLFNLEYDPRLYVGHDLLSEDYENRVIFADGSWIDEKAFYNASTGKIKYVDDNDAYTSEEIKKINTDVKNKISMSNLAIKTNYFNYLDETKKEYNVTEIEEDTPASS